MRHLLGQAQPALWLGTSFGFPLPDWWHRIEEDQKFEEGANYGIGAAYALIGFVACVQLFRIQIRVPEYGWTTQKVFHLLNLLLCIVRAFTFFFRTQLEDLHPTITRLIMMDLPGLLFFTTYTLLVLFWAEIYHQARSLPTGLLRPIFLCLNIVVYSVQAGLWALVSYGSTEAWQELGYIVSDVFLGAVSLMAAAGFVLYGGRLFLMLQRFPIESRGRRKKLREVGLVTTICAGCFSFRAAMVAMSAFDRANLELDLMGHPLLNILYYSLVEVLPAAAVLFILRKLPPKRVQPPPSNGQGYQPLPTQ